MSDELLFTFNPLLIHFAWFVKMIKAHCQWTRAIDWDPKLWVWWAFANGALVIIVRRKGASLFAESGLIYRRGDFSEPAWVRDLYSNPGGPDVWVDFLYGSYEQGMLFLDKLEPPIQKMGWCRQSTDQIHVRDFSKMPLHPFAPKPYNNQDAPILAVWPSSAP
jgi:hypothetical protein